MAAVIWKEEGMVPAWSDGGGRTEIVVDHIIRMKRASKNHPPKFKLHKI